MDNKIIATVGPASDSDETIRELIDAGVDVFRLNFSHGTHETHGAAIARIRAAAEQRGPPRRDDAGSRRPEDSDRRAERPCAGRLRPGDTLRVVVGDFRAGTASGCRRPTS